MLLHLSYIPTIAFVLNVLSFEDVGNRIRTIGFQDQSTYQSTSPLILMIVIGFEPISIDSKSIILPIKLDYLLFENVENRTHINGLANHFASKAHFLFICP